MASLCFVRGNQRTVAGTKLWAVTGRRASDVRLVNRQPSGLPIAAPGTGPYQSETDQGDTLNVSLDCQGARGQCTKDWLLSGNRLQKRYRDRPVAPLKSPKNCSLLVRRDI
ncbi:hypothetical protein D3C80_1863790 [compost metagenome]